MEAHQAIDSLSAEERLFSALLNGSPLSEYEGLLGEVQDVDAKDMQGRTALHVAVRVGKDDWVERLLGMGADPRLRDAGGDDVLQVAEVMSTSSTDDAILRDRMKILMLVRMVYQQDGVQNRFQSVPMAPVNSESNEVVLGMSEQIGSLKETVVNLERELKARDAPLIALECGVTSVVEKSTSLEGTVHGREAREGVAGASVVFTEGEWVDAGQRELVEAMMRITTILDENFQKESFVQGIYRWLISESLLTAAILRFIAKQPGVSVYIDCSYYTIEKMKERLKNHEGVERCGAFFNSFVDYSEMRAYVSGARCSGIGKMHEMDSVCAPRLVGALCQLSMYIAFKNGGSPYAEIDKFNRRCFEDILLLALKMKETDTDLNFIVKDALKGLYMQQKELSLISAVPQMIAQYGSSSKEVCEQRRVFPLLFEYFEGHVMSTLLSAVSP